MNKRIIAMIVSLVVIVGLMSSGSSYAWFVTSAKKSQSITVSLVSSVHSANISDLDDENKITIMQGDNLINLDGKSAMLRIENQSTAATQLRISIEYTSYKSGKAEQVIYSGSADDDIIVEFADRKWSKNVNGSGTCHYYYVGSAYNSETLSSLDELPSIGADVATIDAISSIAYKDSISYAYSGREVNLKVRFESKQADNITWSAVDSYVLSGSVE